MQQQRPRAAKSKWINKHFFLKEGKGLSMKIMNLQLHQLSTQCQWKVNQLLFNSQRVGKASLKEKNFKNSDPEEISPTRKTWFSLPVPWDQNSYKDFFMSLPAHPPLPVSGIRDDLDRWSSELWDPIALRSYSQAVVLFLPQIKLKTLTLCVCVCDLFLCQYSQQPSGSYWFGVFLVVMSMQLTSSTWWGS